MIKPRTLHKNTYLHYAALLSRAGECEKSNVVSESTVTRIYRTPHRQLFWFLGDTEFRKAQSKEVSFD